MNTTLIDTARITEMLSRGHLLGDLDTVKEVARELRIAAEETLGMNGLVMYLRSPANDLLEPCVACGTDTGAGAALPELVRRAERERRSVRDAHAAGPGSSHAWPLVIGGRVIGVVTGEAEDGEAGLFEVLAGVAAHAFERAMLLESRAAERRLSLLRGACLGYVQDHLRQVLGSGNVDEYLDSAVESVRDALGFRMVLLRVYDTEAEAYVGRASTGLPPEAREACFARRVTRDEIAPLFAPAFRVGRSYFVSHESSVWKGREERVYVPDLGPRDAGEWHPEDCLLVPVEDGRGNRIGYLSVDDPADRRPPSHEIVGILEIFADLIALGLEREMLRKDLLGSGRGRRYVGAYRARG